MTPLKTFFIAFGFVTLIITFIASRGRHSYGHKALAYFAMPWEAMTAIVAILGRREWWRFCIVSSTIVIACFLAVFLTDSLNGLPLWRYALRMLRRGWQQFREEWSGWKWV